MKKSTIGVYFNGLMGPWISGITRVLTDSTSYLQSQVTQASQSASAASASQTASAASAASSQSFSQAAANSEAQAQTLANQCQTALSAVQAILHTMNAEYLGSYTSDPTLDNNGDPLQIGAIYFNPSLGTAGEVRIYEAGGWVNADQSAQDATQNAINAAGAASQAASAAATSETNAAASASTAEYWANLAKQYDDQVAAMAAPISPALANMYIRINAAGTAYAYDTAATVLSTIGGAPLANAPLTGIPTAPTAPLGTASQQLANCEFVLNQASNVVPSADAGVGSIGVSYRYARADHAHPTDQTRASLNGNTAQVFRARVFLGAWGGAGTGFSFDSDGAWDSGMFSTQDGVITFMANGVQTAQFDTSSWRVSEPLIAQSTLRVVGAFTVVDGSGYGMNMWSSAGSSATFVNFGGGTTHTFSADGTFTAAGPVNGSSITSSGNVRSGVIEVGSSSPTLSQGGYITWNITNGVGETDFVNFRGGGSGGFRWFNSSPAEWANTSDKSNLWIMSADQSGNMTLKGALTSTAVNATGGNSTLSGINLRAPTPVINFYIAQGVTPVSSVTVDNGGTIHIANSDNSDRIATDYTYTTTNFGNGSNRAYFSLDASGSMNFVRSGQTIIYANQNGVSVGTRLNLNFNNVSADVNLLGRGQTGLNGIGSWALGGGTSIGFAYGNTTAVLDGGGSFAAPTMVGINQMISPTYLAGVGSANGFSFVDARGSGMYLENGSNNLLFPINGTLAFYLNSGNHSVNFQTPVYFNQSVTYNGQVSMAGIASPTGTLNSSSNFFVVGDYNNSGTRASPSVGSIDSASGAVVQLLTRSGTNNGNVGVLSVGNNQQNNYWEYSFTSDSNIHYPNGNVVIHSDNYRNGQSVNGNLSIGGQVSSGAGYSAQATYGGTGTNGSVRTGDWITGGGFVSVIGAETAVHSQFAAHDIFGTGSRAMIEHWDSGGGYKGWSFNQDGSFQSAGDIRVNPGSWLYTDVIQTMSGNDIEVKRSLSFDQAMIITLHGNTGSGNGNGGSFNQSSQLRQVIDQRNGNFWSSQWAEENVGNYVAHIIGVSDGSQTNYYRFRANGTFEAPYVSSTAAASKYSDYAENYRSQETDITNGHIVRIATEQDVASGKVKSGDELALADIAGGYIFGVISTAPGYLINSEQQYGKPVALSGRVPVFISGPIRRGEPVTLSSIPGVGVKGDTALIGFALETNLDSNTKKVEVALGGTKI